MAEVTVPVPSVGVEAILSFKEPVNSYIHNRFNIETNSLKLRVISIISMRDMIRTDLRDPYTEIYEPAGLTEVHYKQDLEDNTLLISFSYLSDDGVEKYFRVPLSYVMEYSQPGVVEYSNKLFIIDMGKLPSDLDLQFFNEDLTDFISKYTGVASTHKVVSVGEVEFLSREEHEIRETIRLNSVSVYKTIHTRLEETTLILDQLLNRLRDMNISLTE